MIHNDSRVLDIVAIPTCSIFLLLRYLEENCCYYNILYTRSTAIHLIILLKKMRYIYKIVF